MAVDNIKVIIFGLAVLRHYDNGMILCDDVNEGISTTSRFNVSSIQKRR